MRALAWSDSDRSDLALTGLVLLALVASLLLLPRAADAQQRVACGQQVAKLCPDLRAGTDALRKCVDAHMEELSAVCRERVKAGRERLDKLRSACKSEIASHCGDVEPGGGGVVRCLHGHQSELSESCAASLPSGGRRLTAPGKAPH